MSDSALIEKARAELLAALLAEIAKHQHERGALENPLECLQRIIRERGQAMVAAVIVRPNEEWERAAIEMTRKKDGD